MSGGTFGVVLVSAAVVALGLHAGLVSGSDIFVGTSLPVVLGVVTPVWVLLYAAVAAGVRRLETERPAAIVARRLAWAFLLGAGLALLPGLWMTSNELVVQTRYLSTLWLLAAATFALAALLPATAVRTWRRLHLVWPAVTAVVLVAFAESLAERGTPLLARPEHFAYVTMLENAVVLTAIMWLVFAVTNRMALGVTIGGGFYLLLMTASVLKLRVLRSPLHPIDLYYLGDLLRVPAVDRAGTLKVILAGTLGSVFLAVIVGSIRTPVVRREMRVLGAIAAVVVLAVLGLGTRWPATAAALDGLGIATHHWVPADAARQNGLLLDFTVNAADLWIEAPPGYSQPAVTRMAATYGLAQPAAPAAVPSIAHGEPIDLIVYLVEAFLDPADLGVRFTSDPTPTFHALARRHTSGFVVAPVFGHGSANVEFELFTGMTMAFLPPGAVPFNQYIRRDLPSLPRVLHEHGYRTTALQVESLQDYNYVQVYAHLGFDEAVTLADEPGLPRDVAGLRPSDDALVDAIIARSGGDRPSFIFAFPNSTHWPWDYDGYEDSDLQVLEPGMSPAARRELGTYVNSLRTADRAIARLVAHFERVTRPTVIAIMGDHQPALSGDAYPPSRTLDGLDPTTREQLFRVPVVLWTNFPMARTDVLTSDCLLAPRLLDLLRIPPTGFLAVSRALGSRFAVLSPFHVRTADGRSLAFGDLAGEDRQALDDARLLQHDLLFGAQYAFGQ
jgi:hypothetical protein